MPSDDGLGLNDDEDRPPVSPQLREPHPEDPVPSAQLGPFDRVAENRQLLAESEVLGGQGGKVDQHRPDSDKNNVHNTHERPSLVMKPAERSSKGLPRQGAQVIV